MSELNRTELASIGEFPLIKHLTEDFETRNISTLTGIGDDAAVLDHFGRQTVVSTDLLIEGVHFDLSYCPLKHLGYKAIAVNLSDVCAMMAAPTQVTVSIAASNRFPVEALEELYAGIRAACERYQVDLVGGDTSTSTKGLLISVTAIGELAPGTAVLRSGAKEGDLICLSGDVGGAYLGLQLLEREKRIFLENPQIQPSLEGKNYVVGRQLKPEPRTDIVTWLQDKGVTPTAMIDVSDGVSSDLIHLCEDSKLGCVLYEDKLPVNEESREAAFEFGIDPTMCALNGGEDYELLFTVPQSAYEAILTSEQISIIGYMTAPEEGRKLHTKGKTVHELVAQGWKAFSGA
ncbi:MAG: thiamine-phosphate kinase [Sphingobacteriales bacterium]|nr:MAG: thiamine-phosphate kinase [Sphingobacteriales bacterium]